MMTATLGCGGDGGGGGDTTAPQVSSIAPADSATDITLDADVSAVFNEAMDATTVNGTSMTISPAVAGSVSYDTATQRATFNPTIGLTASTTYTVTITTGCTDAAGNPLAADDSWFFTTGTTAVNEWTQVGGQVSPAGAESEDPTMMIVSDSPAVGYRHASFEVNLHRWDGATWRTPAFCSNGSTIYMVYSRSGGVDPGDEAFYDRIFVYEWTVGMMQDSGG